MRSIVGPNPVFIDTGYLVELGSVPEIGVVVLNAVSCRLAGLVKVVRTNPKLDLELARIRRSTRDPNRVVGQMIRQGSSARMFQLNSCGQASP